MAVLQLLDDYVCVMVNSNYTDLLSWKLSILLQGNNKTKITGLRGCFQLLAA